MTLLVASNFLPTVNAVESYPYELSVILYTSGPTEYSETQNVQLMDQVTETYGSTMSGEKIVSVANVPYEIIDADTGNIITTGNADQNGEFQYQWTAERIDGKSNVNLIAESNGWKSKPLSLEIYPLQYQVPAPNPSYPLVHPTIQNAKSANTPPNNFQSNMPITISHVSQLTTNTHDLIYIEGNGFGDTYPQTTQLSDGSVLTKGCGSNTPSIAILDKGSGNDTWPAGWYCNQVYPGGIGLYIAKWSNTEIVLNGFGSALGINNLKSWNINSGDPITIAVFGPNQQGKATYQLTVISSIEEHNFTQEQQSITNSNTSYQVTFTESGLQQTCWFWIFGCSLPSWSVTLKGNTETSTSTSLVFNNVSVGTFSYLAGSSGYTTSPSNGIVQINGNTNQIINFVKNQ